MLDRTILMLECIRDAKQKLIAEHKERIAKEQVEIDRLRMDVLDHERSINALMEMMK